MTVVDASVVVKWFAVEDHWETARRLAAFETQLAAPSHVLVETGRGLLRHRRNATLTSRQAMDALAGLRTSLTLVPTELLAELAFEIADASSITIYDALYVAAARELDCAFVTADAGLVRAARDTPWRKHAILLQDWAARHNVPPLQP